MLMKKREYQRFCLCLRYALLKLSVQPLTLFFSVIFPIGWTVAYYFIFSYHKLTQYGDFGDYYPAILFWSAGPMFFSVISISLFVLPNNSALDRIHRRLKVYRSLGVSQRDYIFANITALFVYYLSVFIVEILITNFAFKIFLGAGCFFLVIFISFVVFWIASTIGFFIGTLPKRDKSVFLVIMIFFYPTLLLSGVTIPPAVFDGAQLGFHNYVWGGVTSSTHYSWFKFIQFLTPIGTGIYFVQNSMIYDKTGVNLFFWDVDWIGIFLQLAFGVGAYLTSVKKFKWK